VIMKRYCFALIGIFVLIFVLAGTSYSWQGRMGGMGDPYGLLEDESDFLIHPAKIVAGEGVRLYSGYRFTYTGVADWELSWARFTPAGVFANEWLYDFTGDEYRHEALLGTAFPLGQGRLGIFVTYDTMRGDYDVGRPLTPILHNEQENDLDAFAVHLIYGLPLGGFNLGGEIQLASRQEESQWSSYNDVVNSSFLNTFWFWELLSPRYDSSYIEALLKGSLEGAIGPIETAFTLRGGLILGGGDNEWEVREQIFGLTRGVDMVGDVEGWQIRGDLWLRYPLSDSLALPFLVRVDYQTKIRNGDGAGWGDAWAGDQFDYKNTEQGLEIEVGGGLDWVLAANTRVAAGIYYDYLQGRNELSLYFVDPLNWVDEYYVLPDGVEHRVMIRFAGEQELSPAVVLRGGFNAFYGWVRQERIRTTTMTDISIPMDGPHWGIGGSLGGSVRFQRFTLEPFVSGGYQILDIAGEGEEVFNGVLTMLHKYDESRDEWFVGGGVSLIWGSEVKGAEGMSEAVAEPGVGEPSVTAHKCPKCGRTFPAEYVYCPYDKTTLEKVTRKQ
jgi:hypothetical protein